MTSSRHSPRGARAAALALSLLLPGCGMLQDNAPGLLSPHRGAKIVAPPDLSARPAEALATYYAASYAACVSFREALLSTATTVNATADYTALILNALGSLAAPVAAAHMLAAGASAATGLKSTFAHDVMSDSAVNMTIALDKVYFQPMAVLAETSLGEAATPPAAAAIAARIISLQAQCSMDEARAYINQNLNLGPARAATGRALP